LRLPTIDGDPDHAHALIEFARPVHSDTRQRSQSGQQLGGQHLFVISQGIDPLLQQVGQARAQPNNARHVVIARLVAVRQAVRLDVLFALRPRAALTQRRQMPLNTRRDVQQSGAQRPQQRLVPRGCQQVCPQGPNIHRHMAQRLRCIHQQQDLALFGDPAHRFDRL
jgi:hypothetical protein